MKFPTIESGRNYRAQLQQIRVALTPTANAINVKRLRVIDCLPFFSKKNACDLLGCKNKKHGGNLDPTEAEVYIGIPSAIAFVFFFASAFLFDQRAAFYPLGILCQIIACYSVFWAFKARRTAINVGFHRAHIGEEGFPAEFNPNVSDGELLRQLLWVRISQTEGVVKRTISTLCDILPQERVTADTPSGIAYRDSTLTAAMNPEEREWMTGGAAGLKKFDDYAGKKLSALRGRADALGKAVDSSEKLDCLGLCDELTLSAIKNVESKIRDGIDEVLGELGALSLHCSRIVTAHLGKSVAEETSQTRMRIVPEAGSAPESSDPDSEALSETAHAKTRE